MIDREQQLLRRIAQLENDLGRTKQQLADAIEANLRLRQSASVRVDLTAEERVLLDRLNKRSAA